MDEMKNISTVTIWKDGVSKTAELFALRCVGDDLATNAVFYYELRETSGEVLVTGNLTMNGTDYATWNNTVDANTAAYNWAATKLNLTII
jgi:stress response protein SCP2